MSLFDSIKHLVVEEDPNAPPKPEPVAAAPARQPQNIPGIPGIPGIPSVSPAPVAVFPVPVTTPGTAPADANLTANFAEKLRGKYATSPFADLLTRFHSSLETLHDFIPEEGNRFRASLKQVPGATPEQLTQAYDSLNAILDAEYTKFKGVMDKQKAQEVDTREAQVQQINDAIAAKNKEIEAMMTQRDGIAGDILSAKQKLNGALTSFEGAVSSLHAEVGDSLQKLRIYFPTATTTAKK